MKMGISPARNLQVVLLAPKPQRRPLAAWIPSREAAALLTDPAARMILSWPSRQGKRIWGEGSHFLTQRWSTFHGVNSSICLFPLNLFSFSVSGVLLRTRGVSTVRASTRLTQNKQMNDKKMQNVQMQHE